MSATASQIDDRPVRLTRWLPGPPENAWRYLADPRLFSTWVDGGSIEPRLGGGVSLRLPTESGDAAIVRATVTQIDPPRLLEFAWKDEQIVPGRVAITLERRGDQTLLTLTQTREKPGSTAAVLAAWSGALAALTSTVGNSGAPPSLPPAGPGSTTSMGSTTDPARRDLARAAWFRTPAALALISVLIVAGVGGAILVPRYVFSGPPPPKNCSIGSPPGVREPGPAGDLGWEKLNSTCGPWLGNGTPVLFYVGSIACPYCAASSWAIYGALANFSTSTTGARWGVSSPNDVYPSTPEVDLNAVSTSGPYLTYQGDVGNNPTTISVPSVGPPGSNYVSTYDGGGSIPFLVVGGLFVHTGALVSPSIFEGPSGMLTPAQVNSALSTGSASPCDGSLAGTILCAQDWIEAYMWKVDTVAGIAPPAQVEANATIAADYAQIR